MTWIIAVARWLFALFYTYVGASWFSYKLFGTAWPDHKEAPAAKVLTTALTDSGIVDPLIAGSCLAGGILLLFQRTAPPGIFIFHLFLNHDWPWGTFHFCYLAVLAWLHRSAFRPLWSYQRPL